MSLIIILTTFYICLGIFNIKVYNNEYDNLWAKKLRKLCKGSNVLVKIFCFLLGFFPATFFFCWGIFVLLGTMCVWLKGKIN